MPPNPTIKPSQPEFDHVTIEEGQVFRMARNGHTREVVGVRASRLAPRTHDGKWNTANGFGVVEYVDYSPTGRPSPLKVCDSGDWLGMLRNMTQVNGGGK